MTSNSKEDQRCEASDKFIATSFDRRGWMSGMRKSIAHRRIVDLRLPGSHDTGTYTIFQVGDAFSVTQNTRLAYQLIGGVRYVDLRPGDYNGVKGIRVGHGPQYGAPFTEMLGPVADFCRAQPEEFLIVNVEMASPLKADQKVQLIDDVRRAWGPFMITSADTWFDIGKTTMNDVWSRGKGKNLLVLYEDVLLELDKYRPNGKLNISRAQAQAMGLWAPGAMQDSPWPNTASQDKMFAFVDQHLAVAPQDKLFVAQLVLTPPGSRLEGVESLTLSLQQSERLLEWFDGHALEGRVNVVFLDFVYGAIQTRDRQRKLLDQIIRSNQ